MVCDPYFMTQHFPALFGSFDLHYALIVHDFPKTESTVDNTYIFLTTGTALVCGFNEGFKVPPFDHSLHREVVEKKVSKQSKITANFMDPAS